MSKSEEEERQRYQKVSTLYDLENLLYMLETKFSEYEEDSYYHQGYVCSRLALCREVIKDLRVNDSDAHMLDIWLQQDDENKKDTE